LDVERANARRCENRPGTYEAWYVTANDPSTRRGYWIRCTTLHPAPGIDLKPQAALWAFAFDHDDPGSNWGAKQVFPLAALEAATHPFRLRLGKSEWGPDGCRGELASSRGVARWQLAWQSREAPFPFLDPRFQGLSSVANIGAKPALTITGSFEVDGRSFSLEGTPGGQQHTWGSSHALAWNWGFATGSDFWVDGVTSRVRSRLGRVLTGTAIGARAGGESFRLNGFLQVLRHRGTISADGWRVAARLGDQRLEVEIKPRRQDLLGVTYQDPRGGNRYCYHTEVADLRLELSRGGRSLAEISRPASAAFEYASATPLAGLPMIV
jgi:hypothetical protein